MMHRGLVTPLIKIQVLQMLRRQIVESRYPHGDIKDFLVFQNSQASAGFNENQNQA